MLVHLGRTREIDVLTTVLAAVGGSVGSEQYRSIYVVREGQLHDLLHDGEYSCAYYVSAILSSLGLVSATRTVVWEVIDDLRASGWIYSEGGSIVHPGSVIVWGTKPDRHIGFCLSETDRSAVSTDYRTRRPIIHPIVRDGGMRVEQVFHLPPKLLNRG